jgi:hypothetical protein
LNRAAHAEVYTARTLGEYVETAVRLARNAPRSELLRQVPQFTSFTGTKVPQFTSFTGTRRAVSCCGRCLSLLALLVQR